MSINYSNRGTETNFRFRFEYYNILRQDHISQLRSVFQNRSTSLFAFVDFIIEFEQRKFCALHIRCAFAFRLKIISTLTWISFSSLFLLANSFDFASVLVLYKGACRLSCSHSLNVFLSIHANLSFYYIAI